MKYWMDLTGNYLSTREVETVKELDVLYMKAISK
tara:strand:+ start:11869 stop:11970 length:102 start_codon:yes stop_codon:yes gene_type:complete